MRRGSYSLSESVCHFFRYAIMVNGDKMVSFDVRDKPSTCSGCHYGFCSYLGKH